MNQILRKLWEDDAGIIVTLELLFLYVILILGLIAGWTNLRNAIDVELTEMANSILQLNQGYTITGIAGCPGNGSNPSGADETIPTPNLTLTSTAATPANISLATACP